MTEPAVPDVMRLSDVASFMTLTEKAILARMARGTFLPLPFAEHPYRWRGTDLLRWYRGEFREAEQTLRKQARLRRKVAA